MRQARVRATADTGATAVEYALMTFIIFIWASVGLWMLKTVFAAMFLAQTASVSN